MLYRLTYERNGRVMYYHSERVGMPFYNVPANCCLRCKHVRYHESICDDDDSGWFCNYHNDLPMLSDLSVRRPEKENNCEWIEIIEPIIK